MPLILEGPNGEAPTRSMTLRVGTGLALASTLEGLPIISVAAGPSGDQHEVYVTPSANDAQAIEAALYQSKRVRLSNGVFTIAQPIYVPAGAVIVGAGTGTGRSRTEPPPENGTPFTLLNKVDYAGPAFLFTDSADSGIEGMRIAGSGKDGGPGNTAILADTGTLPVHRLRFRDLVIEKFSELGLFLKGTIGTTIENVRCLDILYDGVFLDGGSAARITSILVERCGKGIRLNNVTGAVVSAADVDFTPESFTLLGSVAVKLDGCVSRHCDYLPLHIGGGRGIVVDAFRSTNDGIVQPNTPHLTVDAGATEVVVNGITVVKGSGPAPVAEADVRFAGGPVLVSAHNFASVASGGMFAEPTFTSRP